MPSLSIYLADEYFKEVVAESKSDGISVSKVLVNRAFGRPVVDHPMDLVERLERMEKKIDQLLSGTPKALIDSDHWKIVEGHDLNSKNLDTGMEEAKRSEESEVAFLKRKNDELHKKREELVRPKGMSNAQWQIYRKTH